ncbi:MAG TPA: FAD-dependent oxidoreductase [Stellaceae bacterium]|jgi:3-phenylpropionate/trans-cinnamate dioxygenase ferredoxin reductase subunit|nr:FAD-dependent oxidoreductase [Stellaceae bacterium]
MAREPVIIVGASHAGFQLAASLRQQGYDGAIAMLSDEPLLPYQRPPLSKDYLSGKIGLDLLLMRPEAFYEDQRIDYLTGARAVSIDRAGRTVRLATGERLNYGHLVLATGARNRVPPLPGIELDGVCYLRSHAETGDLRDRLAVAQNIVVIGAGFIGLEFAAVARAKDKPVRIVELTERAMGRVLSVTGSHFFAEAHRAAGVEFHFSESVARIGGNNGRVDHVALGSGARLPADLVLISIGVVPNSELAGDAGLAVANGIVVDEELSTADPAISAIGDCAVFPNRHMNGTPTRLEAVQNAADHARCVANRLMDEAHPYTALPWFWSEQGPIRLQIAGLTTGHDQTVARGNVESGEFSVFCYRGGELVGIESVNRPADHMQARRLLTSGRQVSPAEAADPSFDLRAAAAARRA